MGRKEPHARRAAQQAHTVGGGNARAGLPLQRCAGQHGQELGELGRRDVADDAVEQRERVVIRYLPPPPPPPPWPLGLTPGSERVRALARAYRGGKGNDI